MNWRKKALLALVSAMTAFVILVVGVAHLVLRPHTEKQEVIATEVTLQRVATRVETDLAELRAQALGYSAWDDTYTFALSASPEYLEKNFSSNSLENTRFSWIALWNLEGKYLGSASKGSDDAYTPLPPSTIQALSEVVQASGTPDDHGRVGLRWIDGKLTGMALLPIVQSDFKGTARGVFVAGRTLEGSNLAKLTEHEDFTLEFRGGDAIPALGPNVVTTSSGAEVAFLSSSQIAARMPLKAYPGFPTIRIEIRSERPLLRAQEQTIRLLTLAVIGGSCLMSVIFWK
ncbi:MAG TPA: CHASE4 domain-containing protein, partial [Opitutaceae bacterium]|nr:CHASE4 domain-containing protein [Opitutaceae bacterium]